MSGAFKWSTSVAQIGTKRGRSASESQRAPPFYPYLATTKEMESLIGLQKVMGGASLGGLMADNDGGDTFIGIAEAWEGRPLINVDQC